MSDRSSDRSSAFNQIGGSGGITVIVLKGGVHDSIENGGWDKSPSAQP
jgi:hypothetical protein